MMLRLWCIVIVVVMISPQKAAYSQEVKDNHNQIVKGVVSALRNGHISKRPLDDQLCEQWGDAFVSRLDPHKMYFLRSDVAEFRQMYHRLDDLARHDDLSFANDVHKRFKQRLHEAVDSAMANLGKELNFERKEILRLKFAGFARDENELRERWRLRIKYGLLVERSNGSRPSDAAAFLRTRYLGIRKQHMELNAEDLCQVYADSLASVYDPHSEYLSKSQMRVFRTGLFSPYNIGLGLHPRDGRYVITHVSPSFARRDQLEALVRWELIAIRRTDGTMVHLTEMLPHRLRWLISSPAAELGVDEEIGLELYHPITHQRASIEWSRLSR